MAGSAGESAGAGGFVPPLRVDVITIFPEYLAPLGLSLIGRARQAGLIQLTVHDLRDFTHDRHRSVDDTPAGGGAGMVMRPDPWGEALDAAIAAGRTDPVGESDSDAADIGGAAGVADGRTPTLVVPTPAGLPFCQSLAHDLASRPWLVFACGRYEGIDERVFQDAADRMPVLPVSLGDYVLNGGEAAVLVIVEAVARLLPGVLGNSDSLLEESHQDGLLEYPVYTKPALWRDRPVPAVLGSGHHAEVARWRREQSLRRTAEYRPDLIGRLDPGRLDAADLVVLRAEGWEPVAGRFRRVRPAVAD